MNIISEIEKRMTPLYHDYKKLVTPSEVSNEFHLFVFMTMISAAVGYRIWFDFNGLPVYCNLWTLLLGESSLSHKSTAMRTAAWLLKEIGNVALLPTDGSKEGFYMALFENEGTKLLQEDELGSMLGSLKRDYNSGFMDFLCKTYDTLIPMEKQLVSKTIVIKKPQFTWLAGTTLSSMNRYDASGNIGGGFLPRWNVVFGSDPQEVYPFTKRRSPGFFDDFLNEMREIFSPDNKTYPRGESRFSPDAQKVYSAWYNETYPYGGTGGVASFTIRIFTVVKKYALLLAFLRRQSTVDVAPMSLAIDIGEYFLKTAERLIIKELHANDFEGTCQKIANAIERAGKEETPATGRQILRYCRDMGKKTRDYCLETMLQRGDVVFEDDVYKLSALSAIVPDKKYR